MDGVRLTGDWRRADRVLAALAERSLFAQVHKRIAAYGVASTQDRFRSETDLRGNRWIPSLRAILEGGQTLTDTARLRKSISAKATAARAMWGTNVVYARRHNYGDSIVRGSRSGGMPKRQFMGLNREDTAEIMEIIEDAINEAAGG